MGPFPKRLRKMREERKLTLEELAEELGISKSFLWDLEQGRRRVHGELLLKIALYFNVSADFLLGLSNERFAHPRPAVSYDLDPETIRIFSRVQQLSPRGKEQLRRVVEWVLEVDEREREKE